jgi:hypothetical protein
MNILAVYGVRFNTYGFYAFLPRVGILRRLHRIGAGHVIPVPRTNRTIGRVAPWFGMVLALLYPSSDDTRAIHLAAMVVTSSCPRC